MKPARKSASTAKKPPAKKAGSPAKAAKPAKTPSAVVPAARAKAATKKVAATPKPATPATPLTPVERWVQGDVERAISELCSHVVQGGHLAEFAKAREIPYTSIYDWINADARRREMYARAREDRSDLLADEIVAISDELDITAKFQGVEVKLGIDAAAVARNRLRVDSRKWVAAKLKPRVYGEKLELNATVNTRELKDDELLARLAGFGVSATVMPKGADSA